MPDGSPSDALSLLVSVAFAPGILGHEYAHVAACKLFGVEVRVVRPLDLLAGYAEVVHERVERFTADLAIGFAPLFVNSLGGLACFLVAGAVPDAWSYVSLLPAWPGITFTVTAFPTRYDTETLVRTASETERTTRVLALPVAWALRAATGVPYVAGVYGFLWTAFVYGQAMGLSTVPA